MPDGVGQTSDCTRCSLSRIHGHGVKFAMPCCSGRKPISWLLCKKTVETDSDIIVPAYFFMCTQNYKTTNGKFAVTSRTGPFQQKFPVLSKCCCEAFRVFENTTVKFNDILALSRTRATLTWHNYIVYIQGKYWCPRIHNIIPNSHRNTPPSPTTATITQHWQLNGRHD